MARAGSSRAPATPTPTTPRASTVPSSAPRSAPSTARSRTASRGDRLGLALGVGRRLDELGERLLDRRPDHVDVVHRVVVGEEAEVEAAVVAHGGDEEGLVRRQESDREAVLELAAEEVEGDLRPGDVGDDDVEEPGREVDPGRLREQGRRGEVVE